MARTFAHIHSSKIDNSLPTRLRAKQYSRSDVDRMDDWSGPLANKRRRSTKAHDRQVLNRVLSGSISADEVIF